MGDARAGHISPLGDSALVVSFGDRIDDEIHAQVLDLVQRLEMTPPPGMIDRVPAYSSVTIHYDPLVADHATFAASVRASWARSIPTAGVAATNEIEIPVCYGGEFGPDLDFVASHNGIPGVEVVRRHSRASYVVYMIGFAPGFPYLGGLPSGLATPRLDEPRALVPAGSVGIAGPQTGIYPITVPGGWRIIGRTPTRLFDPDARDPALLHAGDRVSFRAIDRDEFAASAERTGT